MSEVLQGHVIDVLRGMEAESVNCVVTSPPYWSLRKYDAPDVVWGGDPGCEHEWGEVAGALARSDGGYSSQRKWQHGANRHDEPEVWGGLMEGTATCSRCGAWRGQYGLEPMPELYVEHTLAVLREIRRVLRPDGCVWWNISGGYLSGSSGYAGQHGLDGGEPKGAQVRGRTPALAPKQMDLMPFRVALAAQADGWWVRSVVIWSKPNAMPESTRDRPTTAHEYVLMLTKSARYWWDQEAVREGLAEGTEERYKTTFGEIDKRQGRSDGFPTEVLRGMLDAPSGRNVRTVWTFPTAQTPEAHFATFPPELPRRCIEASCPREACAKCGHARVRLNDTRTLGWSDCPCDEPDYVPGIVLDPFAGTATTGIVAKRLGRRFVGIELSEKYAEMANKKLALWWQDTRIVAADVPEDQQEFAL